MHALPSELTYCADLHYFQTYGILLNVLSGLAPSSSGLGRHPLKVEIAGSNPAGVTNGPVV